MTRRAVFTRQSFPIRGSFRISRGAKTTAEVVVVEPTGADTQIFCKVGGTEVTAVVRERHVFKPGEAIRLYPELTFLFDPSSGTRL